MFSEKIKNKLKDVLKNSNCSGIKKIEDNF